jgi:NADH:ubiquinone oxidoreductase subunit 6 (subunit J)
MAVGFVWRKTVMIYELLVIAMLACAIFAMRATHLLSAALWLAGVSVMTAIILYLIGAVMMAVIELSLSVGLITILLVFAISTAGADSPDHPVSHRLHLPLLLAALLLIIGLALPVLAPQTTTSNESFATIFWHLREADVLVQIALIFSGVLGVLGLLAEPRIQSKQVKKTRASTFDETQFTVVRTKPTSPVPTEIVPPAHEPELEQV